MHIISFLMHHPVKFVNRHVHHLRNQDIIIFYAGDIKLQETNVGLHQTNRMFCGDIPYSTENAVSALATLQIAVHILCIGLFLL